MKSRRPVNSDVRRLFLMGIQQYAEQLGTPDIKLGGLQIWVHGRQSPNAIDFWDGNWLRITAHCGTHGADEWTTGPILNLPAVVSWLAELEDLNHSLIGSPSLVPLEVEITPDNVTQEHMFRFELDQSYLEAVIASCRKIVSDYLVRGTPDN